MRKEGANNFSCKTSHLFCYCPEKRAWACCCVLSLCLTGVWLSHSCHFDFPFWVLCPSPAMGIKLPSPSPRKQQRRLIPHSSAYLNSGCLCPWANPILRVHTTKSTVFYTELDSLFYVKKKKKPTRVTISSLGNTDLSILLNASDISGPWEEIEKLPV